MIQAQLMAFFDYIGIKASDLNDLMNDIRKEGREPTAIVIPALYVFGVPVKFGNVESVKIEAGIHA